MKGDCRIASKADPTRVVLRELGKKTVALAQRWHAGTRLQGHQATESTDAEPFLSVELRSV